MWAEVAFQSYSCRINHASAVITFRGFCPSPAQDAARRRSAAWMRSCTPWRRWRRVLVTSSCLSRTGTGRRAFCRIAPPTVPSRAGWAAGRWRSVVKVCASEPWPASTSGDTWLNPLSAHKQVSKQTQHDFFWCCLGWQHRLFYKLVKYMGFFWSYEFNWLFSIVLFEEKSL